MKAALLTTALVALALLESALGVIGPRSIAGEADWRAAADHVRSGFKPGDLIVFAPAWIDQVGRQHLGDLMPIEMAARADDARYGRVWELSVHGAEAPAQPLVVEETQSFGRVRLRRYTKAQAQVLRDLTTDFTSARVFTHPRGSTDERPCLVDGTGRRCAVTRIEPRVLEIDYQPRRGILAPLAGADTTTIAYDDVPGGKLVGYAGLHDYYARKSADGVVSLHVRVDATQALTLPIHNEDGWKRFEIDLPPGKHQLRFEIDSDRPAQRLLGLHAEVRAP